MADQREQDEPKGRGTFLIKAVRASLAAGAERDSIWSVARPLIRLYLFLFTLQSGWLFWRIFRNNAAEYPDSGLEFVAFQTLAGVSSHGLGVAISSLIVVEGVSTLMVMYNLGMNLIVRPIVRWHERRGERRGEARGEERGEARGEARGEERGIAIGEERGIAIGEARNYEEWQTWYQGFLAARERGEAFDEPPPPPPRQEDC